ncbi:MAG: Zn-dependent hydrolase [Candidatus Solibacter sp.]
MNRFIFPAAILLAAAAIFQAQTPRKAAVQTVAERLAKWRPVQMPFDGKALSDRERRMVEKLVEACQLLDRAYWQQSDIEGLRLYRSASATPTRSLLGVMGGRWDLLDENRPFANNAPMPPGREWYPHDLTREEIDRYLAKHPEDRAAIYDPFTVVRRQGDRLIGVKYHEAYREFVQPMAQALRDAAALSDDAAFASFLCLRADALLTDDYFKSDIAWIDLKQPKFDVIFAPYETYMDELLGVKTSYGASILIRNDAETRKLEAFEKYVPEIQDALPLDAADRPSKRGHLTPMEVMDAPYRAGDLLHGYQAVADNLPNDPKVHQEKGSKKIFFKNFGDARVDYVILPVARKLMALEQAAKVSGEGYLAGSMMHEIAHDLGPAYSRQNGKQVEINAAIGPVYSGLEEAKADTVGMFGMKWLVEHGAMNAAQLEEGYASYVGGLFRTLRFGTAEAHGKAEMMEFNYLVENGAIRHAGGRYTIDYARMPAAIAALARELLLMEATGDRPRAEAWFLKYNAMPAELKSALTAAASVPVDVRPIYSFPEKLR